jgi:hypothetical protein
MATPEDIRKAMGDNRARFNAEVARVRGDKNLSRVGLENALGKAWREAKARHEDLQGRFKESVASERSHLISKAFSPVAVGFGLVSANDQMNHRQAVAAATEAHGRKQLRQFAERAAAIYDRPAIRAAATLAFENDDHELLASLAKQDPDIGRLVTHEETYGERRTVQQKFRDNASQSAPERPSEVRFN